MASEGLTESPSVEEEKIVSDWSVKNAVGYVVPRVTNATIGLGIIGASQHYYVGSGTFLGFYAYAFSAGIGSLAFFGTNHLLRNMRQKDDYVNVAASGALTGGLLFGLKNKRNGVLGVLGGTLGGVVYKFGSEVIYDTLRDLWISQRRAIIENSAAKQISARAMRIDPRGIAEGTHIHYPEPEPYVPEKRRKA